MRLDQYLADHERAYRRGARHSLGAELALDIERYLIAYTRKRNETRTCDHSELDAWAMKYGLAEYTAKV